MQGNTVKAYRRHVRRKMEWQHWTWEPNHPTPPRGPVPVRRAGAVVGPLLGRKSLYA
jgi:hypothetical protein